MVCLVSSSAAGWVRSYMRCCVLLNDIVASQLDGIPAGSCDVYVY